MEDVNDYKKVLSVGQDDIDCQSHVYTFDCKLKKSGSGI